MARLFNDSTIESIASMNLAVHTLEQIDSAITFQLIFNVFIMFLIASVAVSKQDKP